MILLQPTLKRPGWLTSRGEFNQSSSSSSPQNIIESDIDNNSIQENEQTDHSLQNVNNGNLMTSPKSPYENAIREKSVFIRRRKQPESIQESNENIEESSESIFNEMIEIVESEKPISPFDLLTKSNDDTARLPIFSKLISINGSIDDSINESKIFNE